jgi:hypothetical protein
VVEEQGGELQRLIDELLEPMLTPLAAKRDAQTGTWPKGQHSHFDGIYKRQPGELRGVRDYVMASFQKNDGPIRAGRGCTLSHEEALLGDGLRIDTQGTRAIAEFDLKQTECETWVALAVRIPCLGTFSMEAVDESGTRFRWRTFSLQPARWYRLAVPLGAFAPVTPSGEHETLLGKKVLTILISFDSSVAGAGNSPTHLVIDELLVRCGQGDEPLDAAVAP